MKIFNTFEKFEEAKKTLSYSKGDVSKAYSIIKKNPILESIDRNAIEEELRIINEGLKDSILNFVSDKIGGDVNKIKTTLDQMKEQELKFNKEEFEIYKQFYSLVKKQKELERSKSNSEREEMLKSITDNKRMLNSTLKKLTDSHDEIFNALEEKIKSLTKGSDRKKKYFNIQRASDVLETKIDRYNKSKELSKMYKEDLDQLERFFGVDMEKIGDDVSKSRSDLKRQESSLKDDSAFVDMISSFSRKLDRIKKSKIKIDDAVKKLDSLYKQIEEEIASEEMSPDELQKLMDLNEEIEKITKFLAKAKDSGKNKMIELKVS